MDLADASPDILAARRRSIWCCSAVLWHLALVGTIRTRARAHTRACIAHEFHGVYRYPFSHLAHAHKRAHVHTRVTLTFTRMRTQTHRRASAFSRAASPPVAWRRESHVGHLRRAYTAAGTSAGSVHKHTHTFLPLSVLLMESHTDNTAHCRFLTTL